MMRERLKLAWAVARGRVTIIELKTYGYLVTPTYDHASDYLRDVGVVNAPTRSVHIYEGNRS